MEKKIKFFFGFLLVYTVLYVLFSAFIINNKAAGVNDIWRVFWILNFPIMIFRFSLPQPIGFFFGVTDVLVKQLGFNTESNIGLAIYFYLDGIIFYTLFFLICCGIFKLVSHQKS